MELANPVTSLFRVWNPAAEKFGQKYAKRLRDEHLQCQNCHQKWFEIHFRTRKKFFLVLSQKVWDQFGPQFEAGLIHPFARQLLSKIFLFFWEKLFLSDFKSGVVVFVSPNFHLSFMTTTRPIRSSTKTKLKQDISNIWTTKLFALSFFPALSISLLVSFTQFLALPFKLFWFRNCSLLP